MAILRKAKKESFTVIDNAIFRNYNLSLKAKGLLCQMLSLPDGWEFSIEGLTKLSTDGRSAVTSALNELQEHGYFYRNEVRQSGKFVGVENVISETQIAEKPIAEKPISEKPISENHRQLNTNKSNTNKSNKKEIDTEFEQLWKIYPKKQGKAKALEYYRKARKDGVTFDQVRIGIEAYADYIEATQTEDRYIKHGSTFFSQQAWQDEWRIPNEKQMGRFHDRTTESDSRGVAGATVGSGSGTQKSKVTFPRANFGFQEEE